MQVIYKFIIIDQDYRTLFSQNDFRRVSSISILRNHGHPDDLRSISKE